MAYQRDELLCPECGVRFTRTYNLRRHRETHCENRRVNECNECDRSFCTKFSLARHKIRFHSQPDTAEHPPELEVDGAVPLIAPFQEEGEICVECAKLCPDGAKRAHEIDARSEREEKKGSKRIRCTFAVWSRHGWARYRGGASPALARPGTTRGVGANP